MSDFDLLALDAVGRVNDDNMLFPSAEQSWQVGGRKEGAAGRKVLAGWAAGRQWGGSTLQLELCWRVRQGRLQRWRVGQRRGTPIRDAVSLRAHALSDTSRTRAKTHIPAYVMGLQAFKEVKKMLAKTAGKK